MFLLNQSYSGAAASLSSSTTGYIATGTASGGTWTFDPSVLLQGNTQYFFYMQSASGSLLKLDTADPYPGGTGYLDNGAGYGSTPTADMAFTLSGAQAAPARVPGAGLLSYLIVGCGGAVAFRKKLRARAAALLAAVMRALSDATASKTGALGLWPRMRAAAEVLRLV